MKLLKHRKGFAVADLAPIAVSVVAFAIALAIGLQIMADVAEDQCASGYHWNESQGVCSNATGAWVSGAGETYQSNVTRNGLASGAELSDWLPTIALVIAAAVIIGIVVTYMARRFT